MKQVIEEYGIAIIMLLMGVAVCGAFHKLLELM